MKQYSILSCMIFSIATAFGQQDLCTGNVSGQQDCSNPNVITTAVPFLTITPDSRSGAMGDAGAGISPDANAQYWNASKLAFAENEFEVSLSYSPWLRNLVNDMHLAYLSGYKKINKRSSIGASLRYFNLGSITFTNEQAQTIREYTPNEFAFDVSYALQLSDRFSGGITARYIHSNLTGGVMVGGADSKPGQAFAVDVSVFYQNKDLEIGGMDGTLGIGGIVSNIGNKMAYTNTADRDFIPINLRLGPSLQLDIDNFNKLTFAVDFNKLLVPSPPLYSQESGSSGEIIAGYDPNVGVATGIFQSFYDAPGDPVRDENGDPVFLDNGEVEIQSGSAFQEELREITIGGGVEYMYAEQFAVRAGYFHEHATKGNRKFLTFGVGVAYSIFAIDFSYIAAINRINPLANTLRFSLRLRFDDLKNAGNNRDGAPD